MSGKRLEVVPFWKDRRRRRMFGGLVVLCL
jgi:hypothetical protein